MSRKRFDVLGMIKNYLPVIIFIIIMAVLTVVFWPYIVELSTDEGREAFKSFVDDMGFGGWLITLGIQLLQIFIALIPGEPVELMLGYVWGPWLGTITCLIGVFIGTAVIYLAVRKLGMPFVKKMVGTDDLTRYKFLSDKNKVELTVFILFFIPGTPKDALTYIAPIAPINPVKYLLIATFARIPSIVTSTILGDRIAQGDYLMAVIVFVITAAISVSGIIFGNRYIDRRSQKVLDADGENS